MYMPVYLCAAGECMYEVQLISCAGVPVACFFGVGGGGGGRGLTLDETAEVFRGRSKLWEGGTREGGREGGRKKEREGRKGRREGGVAAR